jgi:hypothetical protein
MRWFKWLKSEPRRCRLSGACVARVRKSQSGSCREWIVPHVANRPLTLVHCPRLIESYWIVPRVRLRDATLIRLYAEWMISL